MRSTYKIFIFLFLLLVLVPIQGVAGSLETSFTDDIPKGIKFGDSPQAVIEAMGLDPEDQAVFDDGRLGYAYYVNNGERAMAYGFNSEGLDSILYSFYGAQERNLDKWFEDIYGEPHIQQVPPNDKNDLAITYKIKIWEFENNAVILGPIETPQRFVLICPLDPKGIYDVSKF